MAIRDGFVRTVIVNFLILCSFSGLRTKIPNSVITKKKKMFPGICGSFHPSHNPCLSCAICIMQSQSPLNLPTPSLHLKVLGILFQVNTSKTMFLRLSISYHLMLSRLSLLKTNQQRHKNLILNLENLLPTASSGTKYCICLFSNNRNLSS